MYINHLTVVPANYEATTEEEESCEIQSDTEDN